DYLAVPRNQLRSVTVGANPTQKSVTWGVQAALGVFLLYGLTALPDFDARWGVSLASIVVVLGWIVLAAVGFQLLRDPPAR
ncbi:hypothetical protein JND45_16320, partial [Listeria monocytogenes]|nr:hypothetical protein [Listeria monocytogenes]